jgi:hypothetical protein
VSSALHSCAELRDTTTASIQLGQVKEDPTT